MPEMRPCETHVRKEMRIEQMHQAVPLGWISTLSFKAGQMEQDQVPWYLRPFKSKYGEGNGTPLQYSCLENPMDGRAWWAAVHEVTIVGHD